MPESSSKTLANALYHLATSQDLSADKAFALYQNYIQNHFATHYKHHHHEHHRVCHSKESQSLSQSLLIVGLGNPGKQYERNRHNVGFMIIDRLCEILRLQPESSAKFHADIATLHQKAHAQSTPNATKISEATKIYFIKPTTFMNRSGSAVASIASFYKIRDILIIHDELDVPFGAVRYKIGGSSGGHNGLKSIDECLGRSDYMRLRFGVRDESLRDVVSFVLGDFTDERVEAYIHYCAISILYFLCTRDFSGLQNRFTMQNRSKQSTKQTHTQNPKSNHPTKPHSTEQAQAHTKNALDSATIDSGALESISCDKLNSTHIAESTESNPLESTESTAPTAFSTPSTTSSSVSRTSCLKAQICD